MELSSTFSLLIVLAGSHSFPSDPWELTEMKPHDVGSKGVADLVELLSKVTPSLFTAW